eukprot:TRINITY_DN9441_c0_g2_i5.p1 TRINITY_DN9441_c0_g2~~TRINITY_DN9441_c0_g2_i5.p1  ORF type:complete len:108 (-),score=21.31 TRINITY_DN9441_c0_g2_i5:112-435(-)
MTHLTLVWVLEPGAKLIAQWADFVTRACPETSNGNNGIDEICRAFRHVDDDKTGKISFKNLKKVAKELGEKMTDGDLCEMMDEADRDGDGEVNEEEFLRVMKKSNLF